VEADVPALVGHELDIGEVLLADGCHRVRRSRRFLGRASRAAGRGNGQQNGEARGNRGHSCTSNCPIMRMSSCSMLWQWKTKRPVTGRGTARKFAGNGRRI